MENNKKIKIIYKDKPKEDFYEKFIEALKSEEKVFELNDCVVDGSVSIVDIYNILVKEEDDLKRKLIKERANGQYIDIELDIKIDFRNVEFKGHVNFYTGADNKIPGYDYDGKLTFSKQFKFIGCKVYGKFKAMNCIFNEDANFSKTIFVWSVDFRNSEFEKYAGFDKAIFREDIKNNNTIKPNSSGDTNFSGVKFKYSSFEEVEFHGKTKFSTIHIKVGNNAGNRQIEFLDNVSFKKAKFFGEVEFHAKFGKKAFFEECKFKGETYFHSTFESTVSFDRSIFNKYAEFQSTFKCLLYFTKTEFNHRVKFWNTKFSDTIFKITKFKNASFTYSKFYGEIEFSGCEFENADFYGVKFKSVSFEFCKSSGYFAFLNEHPVLKTENMKTVFNGDFYMKYCSFEGVVGFIGTKFEKNVELLDCNFKENSSVKFEKNVEFNGEKSEFKNITFGGITEFSEVKFKNTKFEKSIFKSAIKFIDTSFSQIFFLESVFEDLAFFKKKEENKDEGIAIFNLVNFKEPENTTFIDFPLSKTSFLLTDVKEITIIAKAEKILSEYLLDYLDKKNNEEIKEDNKDELYEKALEILKPYLRQETVLKEYRDMRKSFENNRTYVEASELFIYEMDLIRRIATFDERKFIEKIKPALEYGLWGIYFYLPYLVLFEFWICLKTESYLIFLITIIIVLYAMWKGRVITSLTFWIYKLTSNYGESITKPIFISFFIILVFPYIIDFLNWIWFFVSNFPLLNELLNKNGSAYEQILRAFFQLGIDKDVINSTTNPIQKEQLKTLASYEWLIRIISLILIGNILIAIKRRLERK
jgi:uncharacterized protein YjbI with pentapeptide repeats